METQQTPTNPIVALLLDIVRSWERKLINNDCTPEEIRNLYNIAQDNLDVLVTERDLAEMYHKPRASVRVAISRNNLTAKNPPKVRKFYSLKAFRKIMPKSWFSCGSAEATPTTNAHNHVAHS